MAKKVHGQGNVPAKIPGKLTTKQAAEIAGVTHQWIAMLCRKGRLNHQNLGRQFLVDEKSFLEFLRERAKNPDDPQFWE